MSRRRRMPPEYVEKQPTLEDVFFAIVGNDGTGSNESDDSTLETSAQIATKEQR